MPKIYDPFARDYAIFPSSAATQVERLAPETSDNPKSVCCYRKTFVRDNAAHPLALHWEQRELGFLQKFADQKIRQVAQYASIQRSVPSPYASPETKALETFDAGLTITDWLRVRPRYDDGRRLAHPFQPIGMFLYLLRACVSALREIHRRGIQHLDVKHNNICIPYTPYPYTPGQALKLLFSDTGDEGEKFHLKLIDFAYSSGPGDLRLQHVPPVGCLKGRSYQSERWKKAMRADRKKGQPSALNRLDGRCDLYSLGYMAAGLMQLEGLDTEGCPDAAAAEARTAALVQRLQDFDTAWFKPGKAQYNRLITDIDKLLADIGSAAENRPFTVDQLRDHPLPLPLEEQEKRQRRASARRSMLAFAVLSVAALCIRLLIWMMVGVLMVTGTAITATGLGVWLAAVLLLLLNIGFGVAGLLGDKPPVSPDFGIEMVEIPAGEFWMGSTDADIAAKRADADEHPRHSVNIKHAFRLGKTEVTQGQWRAVMGSNPSEFSACGDTCPVDSVSFDEVQAFIAKLNQKTGGGYRLPSEAEWEYACRAGQPDTQYCGGNHLDALAWYDSNSGNQTHPVAGKRANAWGLFDMSGNVWEWAQDCRHDSYQGSPGDGSAWDGGMDCADSGRVLRGGSWYYIPRILRSAVRGRNDTDFRGYFIGFRLARTLTL